MTGQGQMQSTKGKTTYWIRYFVFTCDHIMLGPYPVKDIVSAETKKPIAPFLIPLRVDRDCSDCIRQTIMARVQAKAQAVREGFDALRALLDRVLQKLDDDLSRPLLGDDNNDLDCHDDIKADETWPEQPLSLASLNYTILLRSESGSNSGSSSGTDGSPKEKLSARIHRIREDFEQRVQTWNRTAKSSEPEAASHASSSEPSS